MVLNPNQSVLNSKQGENLGCSFEIQTKGILNFKQRIKPFQMIL
jgi:hypothetical protein